MKPFKILSRVLDYDSPYLPVEKQRVQLPNGTKKDWFINVSVDAVLVMPVMKSGEIVAQYSYKHGCQSQVLEFCMGMIDAGETPEVAAPRELREETGLVSQKWTKVGEFFANPTGSTMKYHFFIAEECEQVGDQNLEEDEQIELCFLKNIEEADTLFFNQEINTSCANIVGWVYLKRFLEEKKNNHI